MARRPGAIRVPAGGRAGCPCPRRCPPSSGGASDDSDSAADVRAAFSWSYRQLDTGAAHAFRLAGLHPGADLERYAVAALAAATAEQAGQSLGTLAHTSMIQS